MQFINESLMELDLSNVHPILKNTTEYVIHTGGKRLRPLIMSLCAELVEGNYRSTKDTFLALELIHNASLIHDDIIDEDRFRRGVPSLHIEQGVKKAVLTGDILLRMGLMYASRAGNPRIINWLSETSLKMVQGCVIQNLKRRKLMSVEEYLNMNYLKSGSLFEAAAALGAEAGTDNPEIVKRLSEFGKFFGNAYQIRDDLMDAFTHNNDNNSPNNDLINGDISLPLIYALESKKILAVDKKKLMNVYTGRSKELNLVEIRRIYEETEAMQKQREKMMDFAQQASEILK